MTFTDLADGWLLTATAGTPGDLDPALAAALAAGVPAAVPGTSHTALLDAGLIPDPYLDRNEEALAWMRHVDWRYERPLDEPAAAHDERVDLAFDGIDTVATTSLVVAGDAHVLGRTANQHRSYRFDVRALVGRAGTTLRVDLASALHHAEAEEARLGHRPLAYPQPFNMVRKMACSFGWDWGPDLQTAGLWRPVRVERWRVARLAQVRPVVTLGADGTGRAELHVTVERSGLPGGDAPLTVRAQVAGVVAVASLAPDEDAATLVVEVPDAPVWWPVGHGDQPLVDATVTLAAAGHDDLGRWHRRLGFRDVRVDRSRDEHGTRFTFVVNGRPVFVRGANWIPDDHLLTRITRERLERRVDQALGAHLNLLRVWGGGIYESDDLYDVCDERGVLVWQDFLLACAAYPEESPLLEEIEAEARENVVRLASHASLVLWNGGNENVWGHEDWGWKDELDGRTWGHRYATELFPAVVAELDPSRPYADNSPYSPGFAPDEVHPDDPAHGTHHQWEVWNRVDYTHYRDDVPRFCSEFGFQGPPTWSTLTRAVRDEQGALVVDKEHPTFLAHQKAEDGNGKLDRGLAPHLGVPEDFTDWHWATQLNQARAVAYATTHHRSWWPRTAGSVVWQLNDCWPVTSWAAVDGDERVKPLWWALRHANAPRLLTVQERDGAPVVAVVNDTADAWHGHLAVSRQTFDGDERASARLAVDVPPREVRVVALPDDVARPLDAASEALVVRLDDAAAVHLFAEDVDLDLDPDPLTASATPVPGGYAVTVTAHALARDVTLLVDRLDPDATVDDALVDLPAGTSVTFRVRTGAVLDLDALTSPPVLRSANDVVVPAVRVGGGLGRARR
ncbi:glycoside hydrolase family 2 protein [Cellulomonas palmilytica]|uniref:glycoside hydrolase family 2 protein n=1 Tax=Cellulomonas palmilytica TaxID=2608402 RepID=UPI001F48EE48|nr:glycoside hydrolase family 2 protein [Cellulomonas palmilytica]UJP41340.1 glycoside hydrolase family 2 protein [Cellulomonas palmilytica]